jgi:two-component system, OmpR family, response regulator
VKSDNSQGVGSARILVVDDEPYITDLLGAALRFEGFSVDVAATGAGAIDMARPARHDLVLLDVMLPDLDGNEVCRRLRALGVETPIVFLTARETTEDNSASRSWLQGSGRSSGGQRARRRTATSR